MVGERMKLSRAVVRDMGIKRLFPALRAARTAQKAYRENYFNIVTMLAGADWGPNGSKWRRPLNLAGKYLDICSRALINQTPKVRCQTWKRQHARTVWAAGQWMNREAKRMCLGDHLHRWVLDALVFMGVMKTGIATPVDSKRKGYGIFSGQSYAEVVNPTDHVVDMQATTHDQVTFEGNRFRADIKAANEYFNLRGEKKLEGHALQHFDTDGDERPYMIGLGYEGGNFEDFSPKQDLWEIHLPCHNAILTFRSQISGTPGSIDDLLESREYVVPEGGCYTWLGYVLLPSQLLPKGPLMDLIGLDLSANNSMRKVMRQASRCKKNPVYSGEAQEDMERLADYDDGQPVRMGRPKEVGELETSTPSPSLVAMVKLFKDLFSWMGGNLDVIGGLSRQAGTARQEELMATNAGASMAAMSRETVKQTSVIYNKLGWGWWQDQTGVMTAQRYLKATPEEPPIEQRIGPEDRAGVDWYEDIQADTPQGRLQHMRGLIAATAPILHIVQQNGHSIDTRFWYEKEAELSNNPDIERLGMITEPQAGPTENGDTPGKAPVTERTYRHEGSGEKTGPGEDEMDIQGLMSQGMTDAGNYVEMGE
jgi:hypothetical protein